MMLTLDKVSDQIYFQFRDRQYKGLEKKRLGIFHVSDYVKPCVRNAYYSHLDIPSGTLDVRSMSIFWAGESVHQMLDKYAPEGMGENPLAYNFVDNVKVNVTENHSIEEWLKILVGESDSLYKVQKEDGSYEWVIVDYKTFLSNGYKKREVSPEHKKQVNLYKYLFKKTTGIDVKFGAVIYLDYENRLEKPIVFSFKTGKIEEIEAELIDKYTQFKEAYLTNKLPDRTKTWLCDYCPYMDRCIKEDTISEEENKLVSVI